MRRYFHLLTLCLLMIAVPLKGVLAANSACGSMHDHGAVVDAQDKSESGRDHSGHDHSGHDHYGAVPNDSAIAAHHADADRTTVNGDRVEPTKYAEHGKCSACATCGAHAIAGSPEAVSAPFVSASRSAIPFLSSMRAGIFTGGLERPPKALLA